MDYALSNAASLMRGINDGIGCDDGAFVCGAFAAQALVTAGGVGDVGYLGWWQIKKKRSNLPRLFGFVGALFCRNIAIFTLYSWALVQYLATNVSSN